jgi:general secretion pathway protein B
MNINVYVYSEDPEQRFVIVDMAKYRPGQRIGDGPLLEAITPNSLVLHFEDRQFRIRRP